MDRVFDVRLYEPGDEYGIADLLQSTFPSWKRLSCPVDRWRWKYLDNPSGSIIRVAASGDKVVGVGHGVLLRVKMGDSSVTGQYSEDVAVHPDYRGLGVNTKLNILSDKVRREKNVRFVYSITGNPILVESDKRKGRIQFPHLISNLARIRDVELYLKMNPNDDTALNKYGYSTLKFINKFTNSLNPGTEHRLSFSIHEVKIFDERFDVFWGEVKESYSLMLEKNSRYLNWRYIAPPTSTYKVLAAERDGEVLGFVVTKLDVREGCTEGFIIELLAHPSRLDVAEGLLSEACRYFDDLSVNAVYYRTVTGHPYHDLSGRFGFIDSRRTPNMPCDFSGLRDELARLEAASPGQVYLTYGDNFQ